MFVSEDVEAVQRLHPENPRLRELTEGDRLVVSEPLADLFGAWNEVPEATGLRIEDGVVDEAPLRPRPRPSRHGELHDQGVLTDDEFEREKAKLLG